MLGLGLSIPQVAARGSRSLVAAIRSLFAANEPGVWYDPSDFSTMFQDSAGTTPVTAVEQPVGLMLDKSKGLVLGPELVTNGDFSGGSTGWLLTGALVVDGAAVFTSVTGGSGLAQTVTVPAGTFICSFTVSNAAGGGLNFRLRTAGGTVHANFLTENLAVNRTYSFVLFTASASNRLEIVSPGGAGSPTSLTIDNISVRELPGNHARQTTATSRPVLRQDGGGKHYLYFDGVDDFLVTPTITPEVDKVQVFAGVRRLRSFSAEIIAEIGVSLESPGALYLVAALSTNLLYGYVGRGNRSAVTNDIASVNSFPPPDTAVLTATQDINGNTPSRMRRNAGAWSNSISTTFGGGDFLAYPLYIGRRAGTSFPFNGHLYSLIVRFGANLPIETIQKAEKFVAGKTGVAL